MTADVLVVGTGLIGTSLGLALQGVRDVALSDADPASLAVAVSRGAGHALVAGETARLVVLCTPLPVLAATLLRAQRDHPDALFTHVGSVQVRPLADADAAGCDPSRWCGGHPMAGRAEAGPQAAEAALFAGRPWFVCPGPASSAAAVQAVRQLALDAGATPVAATPAQHDATVALVSHLPQVVASALAAQLVGHDAEAAAAGPGLTDTTRLAGSPPGLWHDVLAANASEVAPLLRSTAADLLAVADELEHAAGAASPGLPGLSATDDLLARGNRGRALVPVKRGHADGDLVVVRVALPDTPGRLVAVLQVAADAGVNVEDVRLDHVPGRPQGTLELLVAGAAQPALLQALRRHGVGAAPAR